MSPPASSRRRYALLLFFALIATVVVFALLRIQQRMEPPPVVPAAPPAVVTLKLGPGELVERAEYGGSVVARRRARLAAQIAGRVVEIGHREGERVAAGALLIRLDDREVRHELERLEATGRRLEADLDFWRHQHERNGQLVERGQIPHTTFEESRRMVATLEAALEENRQALAGARVRLGHTRIHAPFDGYVQRLMTELGEVAAPLSAPLIELVGSEGFKARVSIPQGDLERVREGAPVTIEVAAAGARFEGWVERLLPALAPPLRDGAFELCLDCIDPEAARSLRDGMALEARVELARHAGVLVVPEEALRRHGEQWGVYLLEGERARWRPVRPGPSAEGMVVIEQGLRAGERLILTPDPRLRDGLPVRPVAEGVAP